MISRAGLKKKITQGTLLLTLLTGISPIYHLSPDVVYAAPSDQEKVDKAKGEKEKINDEVQQLQNELTELTGRTSDALIDLEEKEKALDKVENELQAMNREIKALEERVNKQSLIYNDTLKQFNKKYGKNSKEYNKRIQFVITSLLADNSFLNSFQSILDISKDIASYESSLNEIDNVRLSLEAQKNELKAKKEEVFKRREYQRVKRDEYERKVRDVEKNQQKIQFKVDILEEEKETLDNKIAELTDKINGVRRSTKKGSSIPPATGTVGIAQNYLGVPYVWGGTSPAGFDCSGFTSYVYSQAGISVGGRTAASQSAAGVEVGLSKAQPGDLLYWGGAGSAYHVAIYVGNGSYIHAPTPGRTVEYGSFSWFTPTGARRIN